MDKAKLKAERAQVRRSLAILKSKGLYKPAKPGVKPTRYAKSLVNKYRDVIEGRAAVVKVSDKQARREYRDAFRVRGDKVVVPTQTVTQTVRYSKKDKTIYRYASLEGGSVKYKFKALKAINNIDDLPDLKTGQFYALPFRNGSTIRYENVASKEELRALIAEYAGRVKNPYRQAIKYVQLGTATRIAKRAVEIEEDDGDEF